MTTALCVSLMFLAGADKPMSMWFAERTEQTSLPSSVGAELSTAELNSLRNSEPRLPFRDLVCGIRLGDGTICLGSSHGLMFREPAMTQWRLFHSLRWLPSDQVQKVAVKSPNDIYVQTQAGIGRLVRREKSLEKKMTEIQEELRRRHVREGLVGSIQLKEPGKLDSDWFQPDSDNDGLWTSLYVAAEAFRFGATGDPQAKQNAWQSLKALMFLEQVTGIPGFAARSIVRGSDPKPEHGEWHRSADGKWWWKGDTSSDEVDGHYFAYSVYFDLAATAEEKEQIRQVVGRITDHILDHGFYYVGATGKPTTWGVWAPEKLNRELKWVGDRGLNSLEILSFLKTADHIVGKPRYAQAAKTLIENHGYALNTIWQKSIWPPEVNHSDDELAFVVYYPLLRYERDPQLRAIYLASIERAWRIERPEGSPFFNFVYAASLQASQWANPNQRPNATVVDPQSYDQRVCLDWFRDVPQDLIDWTIKNSDRNDLGELIPNRTKRATSKRVLNVAERHLIRWNGDPYQLDGGSDGRSRDDGTFILLPYWMGHYHRFIDG